MHSFLTGHIHTYKHTYIHIYKHKGRRNKCMSHSIKPFTVPYYTYIHTCIYTYIHTQAGGRKVRIGTALHSLITCMHTYIHTYIHTYAGRWKKGTNRHSPSQSNYMHTYIHTYIHTYTGRWKKGTNRHSPSQSNGLGSINSLMDVHGHSQVSYVCMHICMYSCLCVCACHINIMNEHICTYTYIHTYIQLHQAPPPSRGNDMLRQKPHFVKDTKRQSVEGPVKMMEVCMYVCVYVCMHTSYF
jgi:hypothetical protein